MQSDIISEEFRGGRTMHPRDLYAMDEDDYRPVNECEGGDQSAVVEVPAE